MSSYHPDLAPLVSAGKLSAAAAEKCGTLTPGTHVVHKSWGIGCVASWDIHEDKMIVDFEDKKGHGLKLEFVVGTLTALPPTHILARRFADAKSLTKLAQEDAPAFVKEVLESHGGSMLLDAFDAVVKPRIIPEAKYKTWWDNAKKIMKGRPEFIVPTKRTVPFTLRGGDISASDALIEDFRRARDVKSKAKALEAIARDVSLIEDPSVLESLIKEADEVASQNLRLQPVDALDLIIARDDLRDKIPALHDTTSPSLAETMKQDGGVRLAESMGALAPGKQNKVFDALIDAIGAAGVDSIFPLLNKLTARSTNELASVIHKKGHGAKLNAWLAHGIRQRSLASEVLVWIARERSGLAAEPASTDLLRAMTSALERDHLDEENRKSNRIYTLLMDDRELIADLITGVDLPQVRIYARQFLLTPAIDELGKRSLLARFIRVYPEIEELIHEGQDKSQKEEEPLYVSWPSLEEKKKQYHHLISVEIPKNRDDISLARSYGDLRENFEYKSAKEYARVLERRRSEMERELSRAQGSEFLDAVDTKVCIGTAIQIQDVATGAKEDFKILGAWDTVAAQGIISYLSITGAALLNKTVGEEADLPTESGDTRRVRLLSIALHPVPGQPPAEG